MTDILTTEAAAPVASTADAVPAPMSVEAAIAMMREAKKVVVSRQQQAQETAAIKERAEQREIGKQLGKALSFFGITADPETNKFMIGDVEISLGAQRSSYSNIWYLNVTDIQGETRAFFNLNFVRTYGEGDEDDPGCVFRAIDVQQQPVAGSWIDVHSTFVRILDEVNEEADRRIEARKQAEAKQQTIIANPNRYWLPVANSLDCLSKLVHDGKWLSPQDVLILATVMNTYGVPGAYDVEGF